MHIKKYTKKIKHTIQKNMSKTFDCDISSRSLVKDGDGLRVRSSCTIHTFSMGRGQLGQARAGAGAARVHGPARGVQRAPLQHGALQLVARQRRRARALVHHAQRALARQRHRALVRGLARCGHPAPG